MNSGPARFDASARLSRREALGWLAAAAGSGWLRPRLLGADAFAAAPLGGAGYGQDPDLLRSYSPGELWPLSFTARQHRTAAALCDAMLPADARSPGGAELKVQDFIDEWISAPYEAQREDRALIVAGLDGIEGESRRRMNRAFHELDDENRATLCRMEAASPFLARFRELALGGFYTTPQGERDLKFAGNQPSPAFTGPSAEVLEGLGVQGGPSPYSLGLQLWSLRDTFKSDVSGGLRQARDYGFRIVELAGLYGRSAAAFRDELRGHGLRPVSAHWGWEAWDRDLAGVVKEAKALGVEYAALPSIHYGKGPFGVKEARWAAEKFNRWAEAMDQEGIRFAFHTHGYEFERDATGGGAEPFDALVRATRGDLVFLEMDVFWVTHAGVDPVKLLGRYPGRWKLLHLKDLRGRPGEDVAVGDGEIRWDAVFAAARRAGIEYSFLEDESVAPLRNIPRSVRYLARSGSFQQI